MELTTQKLKKILVEPGHISEDSFDRVIIEAEKSNQKIENILIKNNLINDQQLGHVIAEAIGFPYVNLKKEKIDNNILKKVPELVARSKKIIAFAVNQNIIKVGMVNPNNLEIQHILEKRFKQKIKLFYITEKDFEYAMNEYRVGLKKDFEALLKKTSDISEISNDKDKSTIKMLDLLLEYGEINKASDIHIEPYNNHILIRFRIDGILHDVLEFKKNLLDLLLSRIKILANLRIDEHRSAQDGKFIFKTNQGKKIDVRVSIVPITEGENTVLRLLSAQTKQIDLSSLGLINNDLKKIKKAIYNPYGMILVIGPTGSGKTTTLYEILKILNKEEVHISTIEDPVEYDIEGVSQIQVNKKTNLTFAKGLRAIVRQDPDIIMIGEIRDTETAGIAVNSAMTGHLVLSTLHANNTGSTLPRLLDMGIEPFLITSTIKVIIAQRLVRKICEKCRISYKLNDEEKNNIKTNKELFNIFNNSNNKKDLNKIMLYKGTGCKVCNQTGYSGRTCVFEILEIDEDIKKLILIKTNSSQITKIAQKNGMTTMLEDGVNKVINGITTLDEILRVIRW